MLGPHESLWHIGAVLYLSMDWTPAMWGVQGGRRNRLDGKVLAMGVGDDAKTGGGG